MDAYLVDTLRLVGSEDVGKDEGTVQLLIRKHDDVSEDLLKFDENIKQLHLQVVLNGKFINLSKNYLIFTFIISFLN